MLFQTYMTFFLQWREEIMNNVVDCSFSFTFNKFHTSKRTQTNHKCLIKIVNIMCLLVFWRHCVNSLKFNFGFSVNNDLIVCLFLIAWHQKPWNIALKLHWCFIVVLEWIWNLLLFFKKNKNNGQDILHMLNFILLWSYGKSYRFGSCWEWVNDGRILILVLTIALTFKYSSAWFCTQHFLIMILL